MSNSVRTTTYTPRSSVMLGRSRDTAGDINCMSRRESCCSERSRNHTVAQSARSQWTSYRTDITSSSRRTPITSGKFRTNFSYRKAEIPHGYPKSDDYRNPRRESVVAEFSRKVFEGYDIWEDEDRPVINWKFPRMPIRTNKTSELRRFANMEKIQKMVEREQQLNKRNSRFANPQDKKDTAWWEKPRSNVNGKLQSTTPRTGQTNRGWTSNVSSRSNNYSKYTPRRK